MIVTNGQIPSLEQAAGRYLEGKTGSQSKNVVAGQSFSDIFANKQLVKETDQSVNGIKFSKHASGRLAQRNIELTDMQKQRLNAGMQAAGEKGINESLVMVDQLAFIVNVKNQTVITALDGNESTQNVFTNIDGAVIA